MNRLRYFKDVKILVVTILYCATSLVGYSLTFENTVTIPLWPAAGISLALLILLGRESWPGIAIGSLITLIYAYWNNLFIEPGQMILLAFLVSSGATLQALAGNYLYRKIPDTATRKFAKTKYAFYFLFVGTCSSLISGILTTTGLYVASIIELDMVLTFGLSWWVSNAVGIFVFTPIFIVLSNKPQFQISRENLLEGLIFMVITVAIAALYRIDAYHSTVELALPFLVIPLLMWLAFRFHIGLTLSVMVVITVFTIIMTTRGLGPFYLDETYNSMFLLQAFISVIAVSTLILSATVNERNSIQKELEGFNQDLEGKVNKRTKALNEEIKTRTKAEDKLKVSNRKLRKINSELDNFVYSVSHDLRAPIASTLGLINLAKKDRSSQEIQSRYLNMIENSAIQQDKFIKKILDQSRNSRLEVKKEEITFNNLIDEIFGQLKFMDFSEDIKKNVNIKQDQKFISDPWRLKVIFNNLLSNSIRHKNGSTPKIDIDIEVNGGTASISIQDNGKGISKKHLRHVFKMFYRATDENAGSGLGLYIVKETVDKLNGTIKLNSEEGKGTAVDLILPSLN